MNIKSFLLENIGTRQTIFKNTFWLTLAEVVIQLLKLVLIIYTARILGVQEYGKFSFALSFVCLFVMFAELGLPDIITREFSYDKQTEKEYPSIISFKFFLSIGTFILMYISSFFITQEVSIRKSIWLLAIFILITSFLNIFYAFFRARQKMEYESAFKIIQYVILTALSFAILFTIPLIENVSFAYAVANVLVLLIVLVFFNFFIQPIKIRYDKGVWKKFANFSWPLILGVSIGWIYVPVSSVLLGYFGYNIENGWYSAAYKIIGATVLSATLISRSFFPALTTVSKESKERIQKIWNYQKELMMIFAFPLVVGGVVLAPKIIGFFYDISFSPSILVFKWLALVFAIDFLYYPYACALIIFGQEKRNFILIVIGLVINIVLNFIAIPKYGLQGVVISNLASSLVVLLLSVFVVMRYTPISPLNFKLGKTLFSVSLASLAMFIIISMPMVYNFNLLVVIMIGMVMYFLIFGIFYWFFNRNIYESFKNIFT